MKDKERHIVGLYDVRNAIQGSCVVLIDQFYEKSLAHKVFTLAFSEMVVTVGRGVFFSVSLL